MIKRRALGGLAAIALLAGCASTGTTADPAPSSAGYPVTVGNVTLDAKPERIISLSATATEMLFAIGAGSQVTAVDEHSTYPEDAPRTELSGYNPNAEAIAIHNPDLVVLSNDSDNIVSQLTALQIPVYLGTAAVSLEDTYQQISDLGELTGHGAEADALTEQMRDDVEKLTRDLPKPKEQLTYFYELGPELYSAGSNTFIGSLFTMAGLVNIADGQDSDYPRLSAEAIIDANPDLIFLADTKCCAQSAETVAARAGWENLSAVTKNQIVGLDDDVASRWGPRVVDLLRSIVDAATKASS